MATTAAAPPPSSSELLGAAGATSSSATDPTTNDHHQDHHHNQHDDHDEIITITQTLPPSHILQDGRFVHLPPPTDLERRRFFERSIAKFGLLEEDVRGSGNKDKKITDDDDEQVDEDDDDAASTKSKETTKKQQQQEKQKKGVHPLALASAKIESDGINELNRAINLSTLASTGEYFGMTNIVDPSLEIAATAATAATAASTDAAKKTTEEKSSAADGGDGDSSNKKTAEGTTDASAAAAAEASNKKKSSESAVELQEEQRIKASYILKRKRTQFANASLTLERHKNRLHGAIVTQSLPDQRLRQLRRDQWKLVAPEHGSRALPHATRPTEVVACDIDIYVKSSGGGGGVAANNKLGRLASRVPQYATIELCDNYDVHKYDMKKWDEHITQLEKKQEEEEMKKKDDDDDNDDPMDVDDDEKDKDADNADDDEEDKPKKKEGEKEKKEEREKNGPTTTTNNSLISHDTTNTTIAEPFAIADPTLGKLDADFDPRRVKFLSLQFDIEKSSTGFCQGAVLEAVSASESTTSTPESEEKSNKDNNNSNNGNKSHTSYQEDEKVLFSLQHSLFCAKLFESIRRELAPDTEDVGNIGITTSSAGAVQGQSSVAWLSSETETNFLPAPSYMSSGYEKDNNTAGGGGSSSDGDLSPLCVIHCHEGEVKVQLDCEYTLRVKLVEAGDATDNKPTNTTNGNGGSNDLSSPTSPSASSSSSGSRSPEQLLVLCRTLLLHAQERYHVHSVNAAERIRKHEEREAKNKPTGLSHIRKKVDIKSPRILQSCVSLGSKILFENRIRETIKRVNSWLKVQQQQQGQQQQGQQQEQQELLDVEWLSLSLFDIHSLFTVSFRSWVADCYIVSEELVVTTMNNIGNSSGSGGGGDTATSGGSEGDYRKVKFHSDSQFELYLKLALGRILRE